MAVTHFFTHTEPLHFALNMFSIWSFGATAYAMLGAVRFLTLYAASGVCGGALQLQYNAEMPKQRGYPASSKVRHDDGAVGASAAIAGVVCYYATRVPMGKVTIIVVPVPNAAFVPLFLGGSAYLAVYNTEKSQWAHAAHIGGGSVGILYALFRKAMRR